MDKSIINILKKIENNGFEAYIVGGYVRDYLLGIESTDIDICTNALPKDLMSIFDNYISTGSEYGAFKIVTDKYNIDITTYRKESKYYKRRPTEIEYVNNLIEDIERRDFTINTICMNRKGDIIDLLNAKEDLNKKIIKCIGDINKKFREDPLRILRAVRFAITLDFNLDDNLIVEIIKNKDLINELSSTRIKYEIDRILVSKYALKGLKLLKDFGLLSILGISYNNIVYVEDICGMYSQLELTKDYPFSKSELSSINSIKNILDYGKIDNNILFDYGLYLSIVAGKIIGTPVKSINEMYSNLVINSYKDIDISYLEICNVLSIKPKKIIKDIQKEIKDKILNNELINQKDKIIEYINKNSRKWLYEGDNK